MLVAEFCKRYPKLMHMADMNAWTSICKFGLLSTEGILDQLEVGSTQKTEILSQHRKKSIRLSGFTIRDQRPMNAKLSSCLDTDTTPQEWFELLNSKVFFWPRAKRLTKNDRLNRFLATYSEDLQLVLQIDSRKFLERHASTTSLCHINSGATRSVKHKRGRKSFQLLTDFDWSLKNTVAEVTVPGKVPDILSLLDTACILNPTTGEIVRFLYGGSSDDRNRPSGG